MPALPPSRKVRSRRISGMLLVEGAMSLSILTLLGILLLKMSFNILQPRQWALQQSITDAYMTYERASAERVPFDTLLGSSSPWPLFPAVSTQTVEVGKLPGGYPINATVYRFRVEDTGNVPTAEGSARTTALATNPAEINNWKVQSILSYKVGKKSYTKSRTVIRSQ